MQLSARTVCVHSNVEYLTKCKRRRRVKGRGWREEPTRQHFEAVIGPSKPTRPQQVTLVG